MEKFLYIFSCKSWKNPAHFTISGTFSPDILSGDYFLGEGISKLFIHFHQNMCRLLAFVPQICECLYIYRPLTPFDPPLTPFDPPFKCNYLIDYNLESKIVHPHIGLIPYLYACAKIGCDSYTVELEISIICLMKQTNFHFWSQTENGKKSCRGCKLLQIVLALLKNPKVHVY